MGSDEEWQYLNILAWRPPWLHYHGDHLGSTIMETNNLGAMTIDEKYFAGVYPRKGQTARHRQSGHDHRFTGHPSAMLRNRKKDASGLQYFSARYYDPSIGTFVSPDTMVPNPADSLSYNRYLYARANPLSFVDPTGHCALISHKDGTYERDGDEACWATVDNILRVWKDDKTGYWNKRWGSPEFFQKYIAPYAGNDYDFMQSEYKSYFSYKDEQNGDQPSSKEDQMRRNVPMCGGQAACLAVVNCDSNCMVTLGIDAIGVTASAAVFIVPIACGPAYLACEAGTVGAVTGSATVVGWIATGSGAV